MSDPTSTPTIHDREALLAEIGPLPLSGQAWPDWVRILAWIVLAVLGMQAISAGIRMPQDQSNLLMAGVGIVAFLALAVLSWHMQMSVTTIDETGLRQTWIRQRQVAWDDIRLARFVPLLFTQRLVVIPWRGRPVVFQGGTRELQVAFAKISMLYRNRPNDDPVQEPNRAPRG